MTMPGEYRLLHEFRTWADNLPVLVTLREDDRFLCTTADFAHWAKGRKQMRMEYFYREMRRKHSILMDPDGPIGGQWNYVSDNRPPLKWIGYSGHVYGQARRHHTGCHGLGR